MPPQVMSSRPGIPKKKGPCWVHRQGWSGRSDVSLKNVNLCIHSPLRRRKLSLETSNSAQKASIQGSRFTIWDLCVGSPFQLRKEKENLSIILELEEPWQTWGPHSFYHGRDASPGRRECPRVKQLVSGGCGPCPHGSIAPSALHFALHGY